MKKHSSSLLLLFSLTLLSYFNSLFNEFVTDDIKTIVQNPEMAHFSQNFFRYAPADILFSLVYQFAGIQPFLYHLQNILWHTFVAGLLYFVILSLTKEKTLTLITSLLFAVHPIHTEAVNWVSALPYLLYTFTILLTLGIFILAKNIKPYWYILPILVLSFVTYYIDRRGMILPVLLLIYIFLYSKKQLLLWWISTVAVALGYGFLGQVVNTVVDSTSSNATPGAPIERIPAAIGEYLTLLAFPINLTFNHELFITRFQLFISFLVMVGFVLLTLYFFKKNKYLALASSIFWLGLSPLFLPFKIGWLVAERYIYFSSVGFLMILGYLFYKLYVKNKTVFYLFYVPLIVLFIILTIKRNSDWKNFDTLYPATAAASPNSSIAHNNMASYLYKKGDTEGAIKELQIALELNPDNADATYNLAGLYTITGNATSAAVLLEKALHLNPAFKNDPQFISIHDQLNKLIDGKY